MVNIYYQAALAAAQLSFRFISIPEFTLNNNSFNISKHTIKQKSHPVEQRGFFDI